MFNMNFSDFSHIMAVALFILGVITLVIGIIVLFRKVMGDELKVIANQTTKLAQKGIAEDVAGLVGNASALISELNQFMRTSSGIGIFLSIIGGVLIGAAYMLMQQFK